MIILTDFTRAKFTPGLVNRRKVILIHHTSSGNATINNLLSFFRMTDQVSIHYLIARDGMIHHLVPEDKCAWHAGVSAYGEMKNINNHSIGIELLSDGKTFTTEQRVAAWFLCKDIMKRNQIPPHLVLRHSDVALPAGRKVDPNKAFWLPWGKDWSSFQSSLMRKKPFSNLS